jgi:hypothetical protein
MMPIRPIVIRAELSTGCVKTRTSRSAQFAEAQRLGGRQREELALVDHARNHDVGVDHRLGQRRRAFPALRGGPELLAHVRDGLLGNRLRAAAGRPHLHGRGRADRGPIGHHDGVRGQADQRPGRDRALVDEGDRANARAKQRVTDDDGGIDTPPEGVDIEDDGGRAGRGRVVEDPLHEWREAEVDDAFHGGHVDDRSCVLPRGHHPGEQTSDHEA